jgi:hypothetical protein
VPANDLSVFHTNVYVPATAGAERSSGTTPSPASSTRSSAFRMDSPHRRSRA